MKATIEQINTKHINAQGETFKKYGFKVEEWDEDAWVNVVDWDRVYDKKGLNKGDTVEITKPEYNSQYSSWEAKFIDPNKNDNGTQGYSDVEQILVNQEQIIIPALRKLVRQADGQTQSEETIEYPEPDQEPEDIDEAYDEYANSDEDDLEDLEF